MFQMFLGNRYGWQPFPVRIDGELFESFMRMAEENDMKGRHLLDKWFLRDDNAVPFQYVLQVGTLSVNSHVLEHKEHGQTSLGI